jgi:hypothetical protein
MNNVFLEKVFILISGSIFLLVAAFHLLRLIFQWPIIVGTFEIPFLLSYMGFPASMTFTVFALWLFRKNKKVIECNNSRDSHLA